MRFLICAFLCFAASSVWAQSSQEFDIHLVHELNRLETYEGHVAHAGYLWTAEGRLREGDQYRVHVFASDTGELQSTINLSHSAHYIYPFEQNSVLVVGKTTDPWRTHYSILRVLNGQFEVYKTHTFAMEYLVYRFGGDAQNMFFNEPGTRGVYSLNNRRLTKVGEDVSMPSMMKWDADERTLWVVEGGGLGFGDENIVAIDIDTGRTKRVFNAYRNGITDIEIFSDLGWLVANETASDNVLLISLVNRDLAHVLPISGSPRGLARYGRCVAVTSSDSKEVNFIALDAPLPNVIATWDVNEAGDRLKSPRGITADENAQSIFLRSAYPCGSCSVTQSSVFGIVDKGDVANRCL